MQLYRLYIHGYAYLLPYTYTNIHICANTYIHIYLCTYIYMHRCIQIHTWLYFFFPPFYAGSGVCIFIECKDYTFGKEGDVYTTPLVTFLNAKMPCDPNTLHPFLAPQAWMHHSSLSSYLGHLFLLPVTHPLRVPAPPCSSLYVFNSPHQKRWLKKHSKLINGV